MAAGHVEVAQRGAVAGNHLHNLSVTSGASQREGAQGRQTTQQVTLDMGRHLLGSREVHGMQALAANPDEGAEAGGDQGRVAPKR